MTTYIDKAKEFIGKFDYELPPERIAHTPAEPRDSARLIVIDRASRSFAHHKFYELPDLVDSNTLLVLNDTKVYPARLYGKKSTGGHVELLLVKQLPANRWEALSSPGIKEGTILMFGPFEMKAIERKDRVVILEPSVSEAEFTKNIEVEGSVPTPPYIKTDLAKHVLRERYQTIYAQESGSAAAPTAGLHFTDGVFEKLHQKGIQIVKITLHVGLGTFAPVEEKHLHEGRLHTESFEITQQEADSINQAKQEGRKIIAVGTTSARALESAADAHGVVQAVSADTSLFIFPGYTFKVIDGLITNFHVPGSSLLMLISALCSYPNTQEQFVDFKTSLMGKAYMKAIEEHYRFYSFGDACFIR